MGVIQLVNGIAIIGAVLFFIGCMATSATTSSLKSTSDNTKSSKQNLYARFINFIVNKWYMPAVMVGLTIFLLITIFSVFGKNNNGVEFFVTTEPENAIVYVRARGNLSLDEKDILVENVEGLIKDIDGIQSAFAFAGDGGLDNNTGGATAPLDTIGQIQIETTPWEARQGSPSGFDILKAVESQQLASLNAIRLEGMGSNAWAFGTKSTENGKGSLLANPHYPWYGTNRFWEKHLTIPGELDVYGANLVGTAGVAVGFNNAIGW